MKPAKPEEPSPDAVLPIGPGDVLDGKYRVERWLGEGGMGVVFVGLHVQLREQVAVKVLHPRRASDPEIVARFLREGRTAFKIRSEHVARILDVGTFRTNRIDLPYIVMELLDGQELARRIDAGGALPIPLAVDLVLQTCEALACAHALGVVHRDLKPSNLFLIEGPDGAPFVKVLDFGISKVCDAGSPDSSRAVTGTDAVLGSPGYMSPEQMRATRDVDARSDIWSLGMILWEMLVGKPMFGGATFAEICAKVLHDALVKPREAGADLPKALEAVVARALAAEPSERYPNVLAMAEALAPFLEADPAPRLARIANLSRPPSERRPTPPVSTPEMVVAPTASARPLATLPATTATPTPWRLTKSNADAGTPTPSRKGAIAGLLTVLMCVAGIGAALVHSKAGLAPAATRSETSPAFVSASSTSSSPPATSIESASPVPRASSSAPSASRPAKALPAASSAKPAAVPQPSSIGGRADNTPALSPSSIAAPAEPSGRAPNGAPILR